MSKKTLSCSSLLRFVKNDYRYMLRMRRAAARMPVGHRALASVEREADSAQDDFERERATYVQRGCPKGKLTKALAATKRGLARSAR